jgi:hypothetical protein
VLLVPPEAMQKSPLLAAQAACDGGRGCGSENLGAAWTPSQPARARATRRSAEAPPCASLMRHMAWSAGGYLVAPRPATIPRTQASAASVKGFVGSARGRTSMRRGTLPT